MFAHDPLAQHCLCSACTAKKNIVKTSPSKANPPFVICHTSDWHGQLVTLPIADLYIVTGDILSDAPDCDDPRRQIYEQGQWLRKIRGQGRKTILGNPSAPVVIVRGNHDYVSLSNVFEGDNVYEIGLGPTVFENICGFRIGGVRGIPYISGCMSDEIYELPFGMLLDNLPDDLDILVTHTPPYGVLDGKDTYAGRGDHYGSRTLRERFYAERNNPNEHLRLHCFGHVHSAFGVNSAGEPLAGKKSGRIVASNASGGVICFRWDGEIMNLTRATQSVSKTAGKTNNYHNFSKEGK